jgi:hypothetical protein
MVKVQGRILTIELTTSKIQLNKINIQRTQKKSNSLLVLWRETLWKLLNTGNQWLFFSDFFQKTLNQGFFDFEELQRHKTEVITKQNQRTTQHWIGHATHLCIGERCKFRPFQNWDPWRLIDWREAKNPWGSKPTPFPYVKHTKFFLKCFKVNFSLNESLVGIFQVVEVPDSLESNFHLLEVSPPSYSWTCFHGADERSKNTKEKKLQCFMWRTKPQGGHSQTKGPRVKW